MQVSASVQPRETAFAIDEINDDAGSDWDAYLAESLDATLYHDYRWRAVIREAFGHESHYLCARRTDGGIVGVLPLVRLRSRWFGDFLVSMPYFNYGGVIAEEEAVGRALLDEAARRAAELGVRHMEVRGDGWQPAGWSLRDDKVAMVRPLPDTEEQLWRELGGKLRAQIRRPRREGARVTIGGAELLDDFYAVFSHNMRDLGTPVYPQRWFAAVLAALPRERAFVVTVSLSGRAVAAAILLGFRDRLEIPWASSLREFNRFGVNMLLYWEALREAQARGYRYFDFGRSSRDSGTYRFKRQWGAASETMLWCYWLRPGATMPDLTPTSPRFRLAVAAWKRLPLGLANRLGPHLVKNLP